MLKRIASNLWFPITIAVCVGDYFVYYKLHQRIDAMEAKAANAPFRTEEEATRSFVNRLRLCELACYGQVKKFSESTSTCECVEKPLGN